MDEIIVVGFMAILVLMGIAITVGFIFIEKEKGDKDGRIK